MYLYVVFSIELPTQHSFSLKLVMSIRKAFESSNWNVCVSIARYAAKLRMHRRHCCSKENGIDCWPSYLHVRSSLAQTYCPVTLTTVFYVRPLYSCKFGSGRKYIITHYLFSTSLCWWQILKEFVQ